MALTLPAFLRSGPLAPLGSPPAAAEPPPPPHSLPCSDQEQNLRRLNHTVLLGEPTFQP